MHGRCPEYSCKLNSKYICLLVAYKRVRISLVKKKVFFFKQLSKYQAQENNKTEILKVQFNKCLISMNHQVKGRKKPNKTNLLHGNTEVVGVLSGTEEVREGRLTIQCLKSKPFWLFFSLVHSKNACLIINSGRSQI